MAERLLSSRLRELRHVLDAGVPDDLSALDEAVELAARVEREQPGEQIRLEDISINAPGGARSSDPGTSRKGAVDVYPRSGSQRHAILLAIARSGQRGMTWGEVATATGITSPWKRISELLEGEWIVPAGERVVLRSGSDGRVYVATAKARQAIAGASEL